jgi:hypothetical protein
MLKFKFLLWLLTKLLQKSIKTKPACAKYVDGKKLVFQIQTRDGIGRHFTIQNGKVTATAGLTQSPQFTMTFKDAASGYAVLSSKEGKDAFLTALRKELLVIKGDFVEVMWFQGLIEFL